MKESFINKRVIFKQGQQTKFLYLVKQRTGFSFTQLAQISNIGRRHFLEWRKEKSTISFFAYNALSKTAKISRFKNIRITDAFAHTVEAGRKGGKIVFKKYGAFPFREEQRIIGWKKWWETEGKQNPHPILKKKEITIPKRSMRLAEFCGILIGDGGISKYQIIITLNSETDKMYSKFIVLLIQELFNINAKIYKLKNKKAINISISRRNAVIFLIEQGMKLGNKIKQNLLIPDWIMDSKEYRISCLRGMVDTDGSVVHETHIIKKRKYVYPRLNFTSSSHGLIKQTFSILSELDFKPKIRRGGKAVQLENLREICQYFSVVGSSNPKHLNRISKWMILTKH